MLYSIGTIREFRTRNFHVVVDAVEEDSPDLSWDESGEVQEKIEDGSFIVFCARARVFGPDGSELASDYLGNCIYESLSKFADHRECGRQNREWEREGKSGRCGSYFTDMVRTVCTEARKRLKELQSIRVREVAVKH